MKDEITLNEAAKVLKIGRTTIYRWHSKGLIHARFKNNTWVMKKTAMRKIQIALEAFGRMHWVSKVEFTPYERFDTNLIDILSIQRQHKLDAVKVYASETQSGPEITAEKASVTLAKIAKNLESLGERELASAVALRAVALM